MMWHHSDVLKPLPCPGLYFHRRQFEPYATPPPITQTRAIAASWFPIDDSRDRYPTAHVIAEIDKDRNLYIVDVYHGEISLREGVKWMFNLQDGMHRVAVEQTAYPKRETVYGARSWFLAPDQYQPVEGQVTERRRELNKLNKPSQLPLTPLPHSFDVEAAPRTLQSELIAGRILLPRGAKWVDGYLEELCQWPMVRTDAQTMAMCVLAQALPDVVAPGRKEEVGVRRGSPWAA